MTVTGHISSQDCLHLMTEYLAKTAIKEAIVEEQELEDIETQEI